VDEHPGAIGVQLLHTIVERAECVERRDEGLTGWNRWRQVGIMKKSRRSVSRRAGES